MPICLTHNFPASCLILKVQFRHFPRMTITIIRIPHEVCKDVQDAKIVMYILSHETPQAPGSSEMAFESTYLRGKKVILQMRKPGLRGCINPKSCLVGGRVKSKDSNSQANFFSTPSKNHRQTVQVRGKNSQVPEL